MKLSQISKIGAVVFVEAGSQKATATRLPTVLLCGDTEQQRDEPVQNEKKFSWGSFSGQ